VHANASGAPCSVLAARRQVFGGTVRMDVRAGAVQVAKLAAANGIDAGWLARARWPADSEQTGARPRGDAVPSNCSPPSAFWCLVCRTALCTCGPYAVRVRVCGGHRQSDLGLCVRACAHVHVVSALPAQCLVCLVGLWGD